MSNPVLPGISENWPHWVVETGVHRMINGGRTSAKINYFSYMILVTGGTGFLGAHLLFRLTSNGHKVTALKRNASTIRLTEKIFSHYSNEPAALLNMIKWVEGDLLDINSLLDVFKDVDQLYHIAALVSLNEGDNKLLLETNVQGTANVVNAALEKNVTKMCYVSTIGALGYEADHEIIDEETPWDTSVKKSDYSKSKHEAEREVWRGMAEGLNAVIVNPSVIIGPGDWNNGSPKIFSTVYNGLKFYPRGTNGFVDVNDVVTAMVKLMNSDITTSRFIVNSENISYQQLFSWIAEGLNVPEPKYKAGKLLGEAGWRIAKLLSIFNSKSPAITQSAVQSSSRYYSYSNNKLLHAIDIKMMPVKESVEKTAKLFLNDRKL